jgi:hypothetical protein
VHVKAPLRGNSLPFMKSESALRSRLCERDWTDQDRNRWPVAWKTDQPSGFTQDIISWPAERLSISQETLCTMETVSRFTDYNCCVVVVLQMLWLSRLKRCLVQQQRFCSIERQDPQELRQQNIQNPCVCLQKLRQGLKYVGRAGLQVNNANRDLQNTKKPSTLEPDLM